VQLTDNFLKNEKRLNVALARAKALMIVIGNPEPIDESSLKHVVQTELLEKIHFYSIFILSLKIFQCMENKSKSAYCTT
jgi:hypothetical protein